ncbi:unnamed protein product [Rhizophagus irregularis]|nr:unnamed protein product [Rhizophagus irregularis]
MVSDLLSLFERGNFDGSFRFLWILDFERSLRSLDMKFWFCQFFLEMEVAIKFLPSFCRVCLRFAFQTCKILMTESLNT